jgi:hypothetical protein
MGLERPSRSTGGVWTHAWEQEYRDVDGLLGDYLRQPFHWRCADPLVRMRGADVDRAAGLAHVYRWADGPVLP